MGNGHTPSKKPDLFPTASAQQPSSASVSWPTNVTEGPAVPSPRHVLPKDLPSAIKQLEDQDLNRLIAAAVAEQKRRDAKPRKSKTSQASGSERLAPSLTTGKLNAVRAAFKAGLKPSQIGRQFGLSQANVRTALASQQKR